MSKCTKCGAGVPEVPALYRANRPGDMPADWRCREHLPEAAVASLGDELMSLVEVIQGVGECTAEDNNEH